MDIKEIALKIARDEGSMRQIRHKGIDGIEYHFETDDELVAFAEALVAEIQRQSEPYQVAYRWKEKSRWLSWYVDWTWHDKAKELEFPIEYAYSFPPDKAQIEQSEQIGWVHVDDIEYDGTTHSLRTINVMPSNFEKWVPIYIHPSDIVKGK